MSGIENERYYPATVDEVYAALQTAVPRIRAKVKRSDEFTKSLTISTPASGFSWGATLSAQVIATGDGATVRVGGAAKVGVNLTAKGPEYKNTIKLLDETSAVLQARRGG